jgi:hypothetical protein
MQVSKNSYEINLKKEKLIEEQGIKWSNLWIRHKWGFNFSLKRLSRL